MPEELTFPSKNWFERLAAFMRADESSFRLLGPVDCSMVVKVGRDAETELFEVVFEAFGVRAIRRLERIEVVSNWPAAPEEIELGIDPRWAPGTEPEEERTVPEIRQGPKERRSGPFRPR